MAINYNYKEIEDLGVGEKIDTPKMEFWNFHNGPTQKSWALYFSRSPPTQYQNFQANVINLKEKGVRNNLIHIW